MDMLDSNLNANENSNTEQNYDNNEIFKTDKIDIIEQIDMTDLELAVYEIDEDSDKTGSYWKQFLHGWYTFYTLFNECFTLPRTKMFHVNINTDLISKEGSEKRVIWLLTSFALFQILTFSILVITLLRSLKNNLEVKTIMYDTELDIWPVVQKLVVIFGDGTAFFLVMYKNLELAIVQDQKFNFDERGFFAYDQINHIQTLVGNPFALNYMHYSKFHYKKIPGSDMASRKGDKTPFNDKKYEYNDWIDDSTPGVRYNQNFWVIGGNLGTQMKNSYIWNIHKKKWTMGPNYNRDTHYDFTYTCGLALNSSAVLFVGVRKTVDSLPEDCISDAIDFHGRTVPKFTVVYNFEKYAWIEQDSLTFPLDENDSYEYDYGDNRACTIDQKKNQSRLIVISNIFYFDHPQNTDADIVYLSSIDKYSRNLAWYSDPHEIKWYPLNVKNSVPGQHGVLTVFKGLIYYFQPHESFNNIGYVVKIENSIVEFIPLGTKMPHKYCQKANDKQCIQYFDNRQVIGFTKY